MKNQNIFPKESIKRFADKNGLVIVNTQKNTYPKKATNQTLFTIKSHWEITSEIYQNSVEIPFQQLIDKLLTDKKYRLLNTDQITISNFYALWCARSFVMNINPAPIRLFPPTMDFFNNLLSPRDAHDSGSHIYPMHIENGVISSQNRISFSLHATYELASQNFKSAMWQIITANPDNLFAIPKNANIEVAYIPLTPELALHCNQELEANNEASYSIYLSQQARKAIEFITRP